MRELITVSLGPLSNYTQTHFWNFQDEAAKNPDVQRNPILYMETSKSQSIYPRSLFIDFQSAFGNYRSSFSLKPQSVEEVTEDSLHWHGKLVKSE